MYTGTNPTALQSQKWITESLISLMEKKSYPQITIRDICNQADLSRQTFYNVFDNKEDILRLCLQKSCEERLQHLIHQESITAADIVTAFTAVLEENKHLLSLMIENHLEGILAEEIAKATSVFTDSFVKDEKQKERLPYSKVLLNGALAHLVVYWFQQENPISVEQLTELVSDFLEGNLFAL